MPLKQFYIILGFLRLFRKLNGDLAFIQKLLVNVFECSQVEYEKLVFRIERDNVDGHTLGIEDEAGEFGFFL